MRWGVLGALLVAAKRLKGAGGTLGSALGAAGDPLTRSAKRLHMLFGVQVLLGILSWVGYRPDSIGPMEWGLSIAHVLFGGLFLAQAVCAWLWCGRLNERESLAGAAATSGGAA